MSISVKQESGDSVTIVIKGRFDFSLVMHFREAYKDLAGKKITIDMRDVEYMDSAGLGMLLNMLKHLEAEDRSIKLLNCRPQIKKILLISRFDRKFVIG